MGSKSKMKCHYEVLGLKRDCEDDEIKKSYRKMALKYHPDKNPDNIEECTKFFHLVQQAYDVLIDPQERAWYDKHREAILKGGLGHGEKYEDNCLDVYQYFNTSCFSGYGDDETGFYTVFREVFKTISTEDAEFKDDDEDELDEAPEFGDSTSSYEDVVHPFYAYWESYVTAKSYVWEEKYDTREAPNRMVRRLMEQDNKKLRDKARKERNEEVRALVGFVRKRDKRVQAHKILLEERAAEGKRRMEERQRKEREERIKSMKDYKETGWSAATGLENDLAALEANLADQFNDPNLYIDSEDDAEIEEDDYIDDLFCVACGKSFRTEKAFGNHEKSKKHKENVAALKAEMMDEEDNAGEVLDESTSLDQADILEETEPPPKQKLSKKQKKKRREEKKLNQQEDEVQDVDDTGGTGHPDAKIDEEPLPKQKLTKKQKKRRKQQQEDEDELGLVEEMSQCQIDPERESCKLEEGDKHPSDVEDTECKVESGGEHEELGAANESTVHTEACDTARDVNGACDTARDVNGVEESHEILTPDTAESSEPPCSGQSIPKKSSDQAAEIKSFTGVCNTCKKKFPSRNKLFAHIKSTGHAIRIEAPEQSIPEIPKGKKNKKKGKR